MVFLLCTMVSMTASYACCAVFEDGRDAKLLKLKGTIPVMMTANRQTYNIPVKIWLLDGHPDLPPLVYVDPTENMQVSQLASSANGYACRMLLIGPSAALVCCHCGCSRILSTCLPSCRRVCSPIPCFVIAIRSTGSTQRWTLQGAYTASTSTNGTGTPNLPTYCMKSNVRFKTCPQCTLFNGPPLWCRKITTNPQNRSNHSTQQAPAITRRSHNTDHTNHTNSSSSQHITTLTVQLAARKVVVQDQPLTTRTTLVDLGQRLTTHTRQTRQARQTPTNPTANHNHHRQATMMCDRHK